MVASRYLLIIGERAALSWVLRESRMAFPPGREQLALALRTGDDLLLYTTRGCFHNPTRDRGRIIGRAIVDSKVSHLSRQVHIEGRTFTTGCSIRLTSLCPFRSGAELAPLVPRLRTFPDPRTWSARMRTSLLRLDDGDARFLLQRLEVIARPPDQTRAAYLSGITYA